MTHLNRETELRASEQTITFETSVGMKARQASAWAVKFAFAAILVALPALGGERTGYTTLVMRIPSHARVSVPAVLTNNALSSNALSGLTTNALVQLSIRPDKSSIREIVMAEWRPAANSPDRPCFQPSAAASVWQASALPSGNLAALIQAQPSRLSVRARWSHREANAIQVASLDLASMKGVLSNAAPSQHRASTPGAWLAPERTMSPGSTLPLASVPATPVSDFGLELEFSTPQTPSTTSPRGVVTFTVAVL